MFRPTAAYAVRFLLLLALFSTVASADVLLSYESDIDNDPTTPDVFDIEVGQTATVTISLSALGNETRLFSIGFLFAGSPMGVHPNVVVENGSITLSGFMWDEPFQNPAVWLFNNSLPNPVIWQQWYGAKIPLTLATLNVTGNALGEIIQDTGVLNVAANDGLPADWTPESESFTVNVTPEPATALLLIVAAAFVTKQRIRN